MQKLSLSDIEIHNQTILMRVDFNAPLTDEGTIADNTRIKQALPSIKYVLKNGGKLILMSHLGRPKGKEDSALSLAPCAKELSHLLDCPVEMAPYKPLEEIAKTAQSLPFGSILLLENLRFYRGEQSPSSHPDFVKNLANLGHYYVNDAFGTSHRKDASIVPITEYFKGRSACGFLIEKELSFLSKILHHPTPPFYALLGGAKIDSKIGVLKSLLSKIDAIFIGGGMAFTFLKAKKISIGNSIYNDVFLDQALSFLSECKKQDVTVHLPSDFIIADRFSADAKTRTISTDQGIPEGWLGLDIGPKTCKHWAKLLSLAETLFWNGPMGAFEMEPFSHGTYALAKKLSTLKGTSIIGGGDSVAAIHKLNLEKNFSHISTGGGATLEYIEHGDLPGIQALSNH